MAWLLNFISSPHGCLTFLFLVILSPLAHGWFLEDHPDLRGYFCDGHPQDWVQVLQLTKPWQHIAQPHGACLEEGWTKTFAGAWQLSPPLPVVVSYHWCTLSTASGTCSRLCPKILLMEKSGRNSFAVFRGWWEVLLLPWDDGWEGVRWGGGHKQDSFWGSEEMREAEVQFLISRKLLSLISVSHFREDFVILKGFTNWIT